MVAGSVDRPHMRRTRSNFPAAGFHPIAWMQMVSESRHVPLLGLSIGAMTAAATLTLGWLDGAWGTSEPRRRPLVAERSCLYRAFGRHGGSTDVTGWGEPGWTYSHDCSDMVAFRTNALVARGSTRAPT